MPYGPEHDEFYARIVRPTVVSAGSVPHRIDHDDSTGNIPDLFRLALANARAILVDFTDGNPNVMYELDHVHARGVRPLLIARQPPDAPSRISLPFYLAQAKVVWAISGERGDSFVAEEIGRYLRREASARPGLTSA